MSELLEALIEERDKLEEAGKRNASVDDARLRKVKQLIDELIGDIEDIKTKDAKTKESNKAEFTRFTPLREAGIFRADGLLPVTLIKAGWGNKRDKHYYPAKTLENDCQVFVGAKMYADHPTPLEEQQRPEGSIRNWVSTVKEAWYNKQEDTVDGLVKVHDPWMRSLVKEAWEDIGLSIRADGEVRPGEMGGRRGYIVESIVGCHSVDFVTKAGAGGRIKALHESAREEDVMSLESMTDEEILAALKEGNREGVFNAIKKDLRESEGGDPPKEGEKIKESESMDPEVKKLMEAQSEEIKELKRDRQVRITREAVADALTESKLPEAIQKRIKESFSDKVFESDDVRKKAIEEAIEAERNYATSISESGKVVGLGETGAGSGAGGNVDERLQESFARMGLDEEQAKIAARGR